VKPSHFFCLLLLLCAFEVGAQPVDVPAPPQARLDQHPGVQVPLDLRVIDESGTARRLGDFFDGAHPVLLVPGYYRCPQLCGLVMHALFDALQASGVPRTRWRIVRFSIDAQDTPADARARRDADLAYASATPRATTDRLQLHLLTLEAAAIRRLTADLGYTFTSTPGGDARFAHPATVVVLTPHGVVSRYFNGVQFDAAELRVALADAAGDRIGSVTSRVALLCAHFDPRAGRHTQAVMNGTRVLGLLLVAGLAAWCWRRRSTGGGRP
jgi:protein SCO1/2